MNDSEFDDICDRFDASWQNGKPLRIDELLTEAEGGSQELLRALLEVELEYLFRSGETPRFEDYQEQFPKQQRLFAEALAAAKRRLGADSPDETAKNDPANGPGLKESKGVRRVIGPYKLLQQIGEGGMGTVYMAEQVEPVRRRVALKVVKSGLDRKEVLSRFEAERQALAIMEHPNIAKVLDAGSTEDGLPYFVMELVNGIQITEFCDKYKLSLNDRLQLFVQACRAIQHAHQKGIIHRDVKPSNVLVTQQDGDPVVKVIDFGLAKALQNTQRLTDKTMFTEFGQVVGTLQYMSPEQSEMNALDIDTRSDVYSLGVLFYELLTGTTPIEKESLQQMALDRQLAAIREEEAPRPSSRLSSLGESATAISAQRQTDHKKLNSLLRGELDWIALKALEKDRKRRYETANELASDVNRFLEGEPITARPPSFIYQLRKLVDRNRSTVTVAASILVLLIVATVIAATGWVKAIGYSAELESKTDELKEVVANEKAATIDAEKKTKEAVEEKRKANEAKNELEAKQGIDTFLLAKKRIEDGRILDGMLLLNSIPVQQRRLEWHLLQESIPRPTRTRHLPESFRGGGVDTNLQTTEDSIQLVQLRSWFEMSKDHEEEKINCLVKTTWDKHLKKGALMSGPEIKLNRFLTRLDISKNGKSAVAWSSSDVCVFDVPSMSFLPEIVPTLSYEKGQSDSQRIKAISISNQGNRLLICSDDEFELWNIDTKELIRSELVERISCAALIDDSETIVIGTEDGRLLSFRADETTPSSKAKVFSEVIKIVGLNANEFAVQLGDGGISLVDCTDLTLTGQLPRLNGFLSNFHSVANGKFLGAVLSDDEFREVIICDVQTREWISELPPHWSGMKSYAIDDTADTVTTYGEDNSLRVWETDSSSFAPAELLTDTTSIVDVALNPSGTTMATISHDAKLRVHETSNGRLIKTVVLDNTTGMACTFHPIDPMIAVACGDGGVRLVNVDSGQTIRRIGKMQCTAIRFTPDGRRLVSVCSTKGSNEKNILKIFSTETGGTKKEFEAAFGICALAISPDGKTFATNSGRGKIVVRGLESGNVLWKSKRQVAGFTNVSFGGDGDLLICCSVDGVVQLFDSENGRLVNRIKTPVPLLNAALIEQDRRIVTHDILGAIKVWGTRYGQLLFETTPTQKVTAMAATSNLPQVAGALRDEKVTLLSTHLAVRNEQLLTGHRSRVSSVSFSNDNALIASGDDSGNLIVWDSSSARQIWQVSTPMSSITNITFSEDNSLVYAAARAEVRAWWTKDGKEFTPLSIPATWRQKRVSSNGKRFVSPHKQALILASRDANTTHSFGKSTIDTTLNPRYSGDTRYNKDMWLLQLVGDGQRTQSVAPTLPNLATIPDCDAYGVTVNVIRPKQLPHEVYGYFERIEPTWRDSQTGFVPITVQFPYTVYLNVGVSETRKFISSSLPSFDTSSNRTLNRIRVKYSERGRTLSIWVTEVLSVEPVNFAYTPSKSRKSAAPPPAPAKVDR